jgi:hypothetical protein
VKDLSSKLTTGIASLNQDDGDRNFDVVLCERADAYLEEQLPLRVITR